MKRYPIIPLCFLFVLFLVSLLVTGCAQDNKTDSNTNENMNTNMILENGFKHSSTDAETPTLYCAYKSDKTEFDIDNVTLFFYYGGYYYQGIEYELENIHDFPYFELYFTDDDGVKYFVKRVEENFVSEKYRCDIVRDDNWYITEVKFNHSESITIPPEVFKKDTGKIYFSVYSTNLRENNAQEKCIASIYIFYKNSNGKIVLSSQQF